MNYNTWKKELRAALDDLALSQKIFLTANLSEEQYGAVTHLKKKALEAMHKLQRADADYMDKLLNDKAFYSAKELAKIDNIFSPENLTKIREEEEAARKAWHEQRAEANRQYIECQLEERKKKLKQLRKLRSKQGKYETI